MRRLIFCSTIFFILLLTAQAQAERLHSEKWYQSRWCKAQGGQTEVVLRDKTRCDCLTEEHAIEFDFGSKWAESIGQALHYSILTGKKAGIVLILEKQTDFKYWFQTYTIIQHYNLPIDLWKIEPIFIQNKEEIK